MVVVLESCHSNWNFKVDPRRGRGYIDTANNILSYVSNNS
jgi:hypothetical protein